MWKYLEGTSLDQLPSWVPDLAKALLLIFVSTGLAYLMDIRNRNKMVDLKAREEHFDDIKNEVVKPMIERCAYLKNFLAGVVTDPQGALFPFLCESHLFGVMESHYPRIMNAWNTLHKDAESLGRDCLSLREKIISDIRGKVDLGAGSEFDDYHLSHVGFKPQPALWQYFASYRDRVEKVNFRIQPTLTGMFNDMHVLDVDWYRWGENKNPELLLEAVGSKQGLEACRKVLTEVEKESFVEIGKLYERRDRLSAKVSDLESQLKDILYRKKLDGRCRLCN